MVNTGHQYIILQASKLNVDGGSDETEVAIKITGFGICFAYFQTGVKCVPQYHMMLKQNSLNKQIKNNVICINVNLLCVCEFLKTVTFGKFVVKLTQHF